MIVTRLEASGIAVQKVQNGFEVLVMAAPDTMFVLPLDTESAERLASELRGVVIATAVPKS